MTIEELQVVISGNTEALKSALASGSQSISKFGGDATNAGSAVQGDLFDKLLSANIVADVVVRAVGSITQSIENMSNEIFHGGSAYSELSIVTNTVARNMGISSSRVGDLRNQLTGLNISMISSEEIIKTLALSRLTDLDNKIKTVDSSTGQLVTGTNALIVAMNDISAANGMNSAQGMDAITKFIRLGRVQALDRVIDVNKLTNQEEAYARSIGKTTKTLTDQEAINFRLNVVMEKGNEVMGAYANTSQTSAKAFEFAGIAIQNLFTKIGSLLEPIFSVLGNSLLAFIKGITGALNGSSKSIEDWATTTAGYILGFIRIIGRLLSWLPGVGAGFAALANFSLKPVASQTTLANSVKSTTGAVDNLTNSTNAVNKALNKLAAFDEMNILSKESGQASPLSFATPSFGDLAGGIAQSLDVNKINNIADGVVDTFTTMTGKVIIALTPMLSFFSSIGDFINKNIIPILSGIGEFVVLNILPIFTNTGIIFSGIMNGLSFGITNAFNIISNVVTTAWKIVIQPVLVAFNDFINKFIVPVLYNIGNVANIVWTGFTKDLSNAWNGILKIIQPVLNWFEKILQPGIQTIGVKFSDTWTGVKKSLEGIWTGIWNSIKSGINGVIDIIDGFIFKINSMILQLSAFATSLPNGKPITFRVGWINHLATGGVVTAPTLAQIGEDNYKEAVLPLDRNTGWAQQVAQLINKGMGSGGSNGQTLVIQLGNETIYKKLIDYVNDKSQTTNTTVINI